MQTKETSALSKHLLKSLELFKCEDESIIGPNGDEYHHFLEIHAIKGDDDYTIRAVTSIEDNSLQTVAVNIPNAPMRFRGMSGVCIVFWSEERYVWSRSLFFHKGRVYEHDQILQLNVELESNGVVNDGTTNTSQG